MVVKLNGAASEIPDGSSVQDMITARNLSGSALVIELNGEIIKRERWHSTYLHPEDRIEIVRLIGGG